MYHAAATDSHGPPSAWQCAWGSPPTFHPPGCNSEPHRHTGNDGNGGRMCALAWRLVQLGRFMTKLWPNWRFCQQDRLQATSPRVKRNGDSSFIKQVWDWFHGQDRRWGWAASWPHKKWKTTGISQWTWLENDGEYPCPASASILAGV